MMKIADMILTLEIYENLKDEYEQLSVQSNFLQERMNFLQKIFNHVYVLQNPVETRPILSEFHKIL